VSPYFVHLAWGLPVVLGLCVAVAVRFRGELGKVARAVLPPLVGVTAWLVLGDQVAISQGIWRFGEGATAGLKLGAVPVEEIVFFAATNLLVALGTLLFSKRSAP
jgi:lycopene cyclase domain-containing protein